jgi:hypothetical protein
MVIIFFTTNIGGMWKGSPLLTHLQAWGKVPPLKGRLFAFAHYQVLLKTTTHAPNCVFPSLTNNTHIVRPMNKITYTFDHLTTQLTLVGLRVKVLKCKLWSSLGISPSIEILQGYVLVINGLHILGVPMGF